MTANHPNYTDDFRKELWPAWHETLVDCVYNWYTCKRDCSWRFDSYYGKKKTQRFIFLNDLFRNQSVLNKVFGVKARVTDLTLIQTGRAIKSRIKSQSKRAN
jgi:hypothetical protein